MSKKAFLINRKTGKKIQLNGCKPAGKIVGAKKYQTNRFQSSQLPHRVDLREYLTPVEDQSAVNSCTANAMAGAYEYLANRALGYSGDISRLFIYYNARLESGKKIQDTGSSIYGSIQVLKDIGACTEDTWPYDPDLVNEPPHDEAYEEASNFTITDAENIDIDLYAMKHCLAEGFPFVFGLKLFQSFDKARHKGVVPYPDLKGEDGRKTHGNHAMLCVGYSDQYKVFFVRNSWGEKWGDRGYCYIPYSYMTNPDLCWDCWTIRAVSDLDFSANVWEEDDEELYDDEDEYEDDDEYEYDKEEEEDEDEYDEEEEEDEDEYDEEDDDEYEEDEYDEEDDDEYEEEDDYEDEDEDEE